MDCKILSFEPTFYSKNIDETLEFYSNMFNAVEIFKNEFYLIVQIGENYVHFCVEMENMKGPSQNTTGSIFVSNVDEIKQFILDKNSENSLKYQITETREDPWGMRAFNMADPNGLILYIAQKI